MRDASLYFSLRMCVVVECMWYVEILFFPLTNTVVCSSALALGMTKADHPVSEMQVSYSFIEFLCGCCVYCMW